MMRTLLAAVASFLILPCAAQEGGEPAPPGSSARELPPAQVLGLRTLQRRLSLPTAGTVVLVPDEAAFVDAIGRWTPERVFPVLIENGTAGSMEAVARFVRAFEPSGVVRYEPGAVLPEDATERRAAIEGALARSQGAATEPTPTLGLLEAWRSRGHVPPGVTVADDEDEAWAAALALAAGHGQPIVWVRRTGNGSVSGGLNETQARRLVEQIETGLERTRLPWRGPNDAVQAVALCLNTPVKLRTSFGENRGERFALTDLVGRDGALEAGRLQNSRRWAWSGQIFGSAEQAVYAAMCGLFLAPDSAWLFDGYPSNEPWNRFDMTLAGDRFEQAGLAATVHDEPRNGREHWLLSTARAVDAGLVFVNSKGRSDRFAVGDGDLVFRDAPVLARPSAVSFVHSWSAQKPADRGTVAGRWFERGAYAYVGSVHEPFLRAFVPTPIVATRLLVGMPWAAAHRPDGETALWKIAVFGDPLLTLGKPRPRVGVALGLEGAVPERDALAAAASSIDLAAMARSLVLLGRDGDAVELARAVLADEPARFDAAVAEAVALAAFRVSQTDVLTASVRELGPARAEVLGAADAVWMHAQPLLQGTIGEDLAGVLLTNLREGTVVRDALALADAEARSRGAAAANRVLDVAERRVGDAKDAQRLRAARR